MRVKSLFNSYKSDTHTRQMCHKKRRHYAKPKALSHPLSALLWLVCKIANFVFSNSTQSEKSVIQNGARAFKWCELALRYFGEFKQAFRLNLPQKISILRRNFYELDHTRSRLTY